MSNSPKEFKGKVLDINNSEELVGVMVVANKTDTTYTDFDGNFKFNLDSIKTLDLNLPSYNTDSIILVNKNYEFTVNGGRNLIAKQ
jgi:hypothetical protein